MSGLTPSSTDCSASTITLLTGAIVVPQSSLTIIGPGMTNLAVSGKYENRVITHTGTGTLTLRDFSLEEGYVKEAGNAYGGCLDSAGSVSLSHVGVYACEAYSTGAEAFGGGIFAASATLSYSIVSANGASTKVKATAYGGGIRASNLAITSSTISGNYVTTGAGAKSGFGGGVDAFQAYILNSTISYNIADGLGGGLAVLGDAAGKSTTIINSTISNNLSTYAMGGAAIDSPVAAIYNSTIAFNSAAVSIRSNFSDTFAFSPGLHVWSSKLYMQSTLLANNTYGGSNTDNDFSSYATSTVESHNLVFATKSSVSADTIVGDCPILGTLRFNGGPTQTIALQSRSPGIDQGNNVFDNGVSTGLAEDQRGQFLDPTPYLYPRVSESAADIGAYEINQADIVFTANFEGCL